MNAEDYCFCCSLDDGILEENRLTIKDLLESDSVINYVKIENLEPLRVQVSVYQ